MIAVPIFDVKNRLPYFIHLVENGETVQITRHGKPVARIVSEEEVVQEQKSEGQFFMEKLMEWREKHPDCLLTDDDEKAMYNFRHVLEPGIRHPEDFE